jgi:hypothetical protein
MSEKVPHEGSDLACVEHQPLQIQDTREGLTSEHDQGGDINRAHLILKILACRQGDVWEIFKGFSVAVNCSTVKMDLLRTCRSVHLRRAQDLQ